MLWRLALWVILLTRAAAADVLIEGGGAGEWGAVVAPAARAAISRLPAQVGAAAPDSARLVLCVTLEEFRRHAGAVAGRRGLLGIARPRENLVALNMSRVLPGPERSLYGTLAHELAHLALGAAAEQGGVRLPRWFDEGVASWFAGRYTELGPVELASLTHAPWLRLSRLTSGFPEEPGRQQLAYVKSLQAVEHLESGRPGCVAAVVRRVAAGQGFEAALAEATGLSVSELDDRTREATRRRWLERILLRGAASPYPLLALLVIVAFVVRRWRYRRALAAAEREEGG